MKTYLLVPISCVVLLIGACSSSDDGGNDAGSSKDTFTPAGDGSTSATDTGGNADTGGNVDTGGQADTGGGGGACTLATDGFDGVDNGDGTITDNTTNLVWTKQADTKKWQDAQTFCEDLDLGGKTDWRLPTIEEARSLIVGSTTCEGAALGTSCDVCDDSCADTFDSCVANCDKCEMVAGPGPGGRYHSDLFPQSMTAQIWTSTLPAFGNGSMAYVVEFRDASVGQGSLTGKFATRCVHE